MLTLPGGVPFWFQLLLNGEPIRGRMPVDAAGVRPGCATAPFAWLVRVIRGLPGAGNAPRRADPRAPFPKSTPSQESRMKPSALRPLSAALLALAAALTAAGCDRTVAAWEPLPPLDPVAMDADAGGWRMIVLTSPAQVAVPAPAAVESDAYRAELASIRAAQGRLTAAQRRSVEYWSGGGVLRWNQVMRELVARFNLPPAPRDDGTYPVPDPENPFADPQFPFANPPYAARAYAYVSVAQYEALKAAWYWKFR
ncbi:MAG TPA: hypothetical protein VFZ20_01120, partial [Longimicrobium sp.]